MKNEKSTNNPYNGSSMTKVIYNRLLRGKINSKIIVEMQAVEYQKQTGSFNEDLLHHMSSLGWEHIKLLGEYHFNSEKVVSLYKFE